MTTVIRYGRSLLLAAALGVGPSAAAQSWSTTLSGASEGTTSPGTGSATFSLSAANIFSMSIEWANLVGTTTIAHIHCCTTTPFTGFVSPVTPLPTFPGFPTLTTSGTFNADYDLTQPGFFTQAFVDANGGTVASARAAFVNYLFQGRSYLNIHTTAFGGGEIRGFIVGADQVVVPEPATMWLLATGLIGVAVFARRRVTTVG